MARTKENKTVKRTYTLSAATTNGFESLVPSGERSQVVEHLLQRELAELRRQQLRDAIAHGLSEMADVNAKVTGDWAEIETEGWPRP